MPNDKARRQLRLGDKQVLRPGQLTLKDAFDLVAGVEVEGIHTDLSGEERVSDYTFVGLEGAGQGTRLVLKRSSGVAKGLEWAHYASDRGMIPYSNHKWNVRNWMRLKEQKDG